MSSETMALAQPNQSPVPAGELCMVQSWTWRKEAAPAMPATASMMTTWTTPSSCPPIGGGPGGGGGAGGGSGGVEPTGVVGSRLDRGGGHGWPPVDRIGTTTTKPWQVGQK